ncbi:hypothetical protein DER44DRAFT_870253 [Fusarium oxysporum]|nr:hypothetical protein DER44DRAFT_870253 [Fusarium oxysporum]
MLLSRSGLSRRQAVSYCDKEAQAHFNLNYPETIGFEDGTQHDGPCGGFTPDFSKDDVTDFYIGGDSIATLTTHAEGNWLYRITLDESARGNWTQIYPIVRQTGLGAFCEPVVTVPEEFIGHTGVLGVVSNTPDGVLYQACKNASDVTATFSSDSKLTGMVGNDTNDASTTPSGTASHDHPSETSSQPNGALGRSSLTDLSLPFSIVAVLGLCLAYLL